MRIRGNQRDHVFDPNPTAASLPHAQMRNMLAYWESARGANTLPPTAAIDPTRLPRDCLPHIVVYEVSYEPLRFRSRLEGTSVVDAVGADYTGFHLDEIEGMTAQHERFEWCAREARPYFASAPITFSPRDYKRYSVLGLPFADADGRVERLVFVFGFDDDTPSA